MDHKVVIVSTGSRKKKRDKDKKFARRDVLNAVPRQSENLLPDLKARANNPIYILRPAVLSRFGQQVGSMCFSPWKPEREHGARDERKSGEKSEEEGGRAIY